MVNRNLIVGLTGNAGSGKTAAAHFFSEKNIPVIDTDHIAREVVQDRRVKQNLVQHFSTSILMDNHQLNRKKLLNIVIRDMKEKKWLESYLHPIILENMIEKIKACRASSYVIVVVPLLFETDYQYYVDKTCVVTAEDSVKIKRICQRDKVSESFAVQLLNNQIAASEAIRLADMVIINNGTLADLEQQVEAVHIKLSQR
jgi:dephospho-CoA kinase